MRRLPVAGFVLVGICAIALASCTHKKSSLPPVNPTPTASPTAQPSTSPTATPTPSPTPSPTPTPATAPTEPPSGVAGTFRATIVNSNSAIPSSNIMLYIYGQDDTSGAYEGVNADGSTYALSTTGKVVGIPWLGGTSNTEYVYLPALKGARAYIVDGSSLASLFNINGSGGPGAPAPWTNDGSQNVYFDDVEYAETTAGDVNYDLSQTDALGLDLEVVTTGATAPGPIGFKPGAMTAFNSALKGLGGQWATLAAQYPYHIINPQHGAPNFFTNATFLDTAIMSAWNSYKSNNWMEITAASLSATTYPGALYGTLDASGNFNFYSTQNTSGTLVGTIENPANYTGETITEQVLAQNGAFNNFTTPSATYPALGPAVGNRLSGAINSGVMQPATPPAAGAPLTVQPICTGRFPTAGQGYDNQYAQTLHAVADTYAYVAGAAYGYPYDDLCGTSTDSTVTGVTSMTITINPS